MTTVSDLKHQPASISGDDKIGNNLSCMVRQPKLNGKGKVRKVQHRKRRRKRKTAQTEMGTEENVEENEHLNDDDDEKIETNVQARKVDDVGDASDSTLRAGLRTGQKQKKSIVGHDEREDALTEEVKTNEGCRNKSSSRKERARATGRRIDVDSQRHHQRRRRQQQQQQQQQFSWGSSGMHYDTQQFHYYQQQPYSNAHHFYQLEYDLPNNHDLPSSREFPQHLQQPLPPPSQPLSQPQKHQHQEYNGAAVPNMGLEIGLMEEGPLDEYLLEIFGLNQDLLGLPASSEGSPSKPTSGTSTPKNSDRSGRPGQRSRSSSIGGASPGTDETLPNATFKEAYFYHRFSQQQELLQQQQELQQEEQQQQQPPSPPTWLGLYNNKKNRNKIEGSMDTTDSAGPSGASPEERIAFNTTGRGSNGGAKIPGRHKFSDSDTASIVEKANTEIYGCGNNNKASSGSSLSISDGVNGRESVQNISMGTNGAFDENDDAAAWARESAERAKWQAWVIEAAEAERRRRMSLLAELQAEEDAERTTRQAWAAAAIAEEQQNQTRKQFLEAMTNSMWFNAQFVNQQSMDHYDVVCPYHHAGCSVVCTRRDLDAHLEQCPVALEALRREREAMMMTMESDAPRLSVSGSERSESTSQFYPRRVHNEWEDGNYEVVCPNSVMGCRHVCSRNELALHLEKCSFGGGDDGRRVILEQLERQQTRRAVEEDVEEERRRRIHEDQRRRFSYAAAAAANGGRKKSESSSSSSSSSSSLSSSSSSPSSRITQFDTELIQTPATANRRGSATAVFAAGMGLRLASDILKSSTSEEVDASKTNTTSVKSNGSSSEGGDVHSSSPVVSIIKDTSIQFNLKEQNSSCGSDIRPALGSSASSSSILHRAILGFADRCTAAAVARRAGHEEILRRLQRVVRSLWCDGRVASYGSYRTGLMGISGSDLDVVVCWDGSQEVVSAEATGELSDDTSPVHGTTGSSSSILNSTSNSGTSSHIGGGSLSNGGTLSPSYCVQRLASFLRKEQDWLRVVKVLDKGRIPIIKAEARLRRESQSVESETSAGLGEMVVQLDISMQSATHTGLTSTSFMAELIDQIAVLRPLALVIKQLTRAHGLADPYTGGVSSYSIVLMLTFYYFYRRQAEQQRLLNLQQQQATTTTTVKPAEENDAANSAGVAPLPALEGNIGGSSGIEDSQNSPNETSSSKAAAAPAQSPPPTPSMPPSPSSDSNIASSSLVYPSLHQQTKSTTGTAKTSNTPLYPPAYPFMYGRVHTYIPYPQANGTTLIDTAMRQSNYITQVNSVSSKSHGSVKKYKEDTFARRRSRVKQDKSWMRKVEENLDTPSSARLKKGIISKTAKQNLENSASSIREFQSNLDIVEQALPSSILTSEYSPQQEHQEEEEEEEEEEHQQQQQQQQPMNTLAASISPLGSSKAVAVTSTVPLSGVAAFEYVGQQRARRVLLYGYSAKSFPLLRRPFSSPSTSSSIRLTPPKEKQQHVLALQTPPSSQHSPVWRANSLSSFRDCRKLSLLSLRQESTEEEKFIEPASPSTPRLGSPSITPDTSSAWPPLPTRGIVDVDCSDKCPKIEKRNEDYLNAEDRDEKKKEVREVDIPKQHEDLGTLLLGFLQFWGYDFQAGLEGFSVRRGGFRFLVVGDKLNGGPPHPQASDPVVIEDPINVISNVGRSSYKFSEVQRLFRSSHLSLSTISTRVDSPSATIGDILTPEQMNEASVMISEPQPSTGTDLHKAITSCLCLDIQ